MGQARRRKLLDPNFGKTTEAEFLFLIERYVEAYFRFCQEGKMTEAIGALVAVFQLVEYAPQFTCPVVIDSDEGAWFTGDTAQGLLDSAGVDSTICKLWAVEDGTYHAMDDEGVMAEGVKSDPIPLSKIKLPISMKAKKGGF